MILLLLETSMLQVVRGEFSPPANKRHAQLIITEIRWTQHESTTASDVNAFIVGAHAAPWVQSRLFWLSGVGPNASWWYLRASGTLWWSQQWLKTHSAESPTVSANKFQVWSGFESGNCLSLDIWCFMHQSFVSERLDRCSRFKSTAEPLKENAAFRPQWDAPRQDSQKHL